MTTFFILTILFAVLAMVMIVIILAQRPQGGGLAGAFGGAGSGTDSVFGGRIGDALTWATVITFCVWLGLAILLNRVDDVAAPVIVPAAVTPEVPAGGAGAPIPGTGGPGATPPGGGGGAGSTPPGSAPPGAGGGSPPPGTDE